MVRAWDSAGNVGKKAFYFEIGSSYPASAPAPTYNLYYDGGVIKKTSPFRVLCGTGMKFFYLEYWAMWRLMASKVTSLMACSMRQASSSAVALSTPSISSVAERIVWRS